MNWWHILFLSGGNFKWGREKLFSVLANVKLDFSAPADNNYSNHLCSLCCAPQISNLPHARCPQIAFQIFPKSFLNVSLQFQMSRLITLFRGQNCFSGGHPIPHFICKTGPLKEIFQDIWDKYVVEGEVPWSGPRHQYSSHRVVGGEVVVGKGEGHSWKTVRQINF